MDEMVKTLIGLVPLTVGLVAFGIAVWFLLGGSIALGTWLLGAFLIGHGLVHIMFAVPQHTGATASASGIDYQFDLSRSWLVGAGLDAAVIRGIAVALVVAVVIGFALAALSTVGILVPVGWWQGLVVASTAASVLLLVVGFSPGLVLGFAIDAVLLWVVFGSSWSPSGGAMPAG
jgi:hypothetical protein